MAQVAGEYGDLIFYNQVMDRGAMRQLISRLITYLGSNCTAQILDQLKTLGFRHATQAGISLGIDDLLTTPSKNWLIRDAEYQTYNSEEQYRRGSIHAVEKLRHVVETWHNTSEYLKREMNSHFRTTDPLNPVHIMSFSGARGNVSQVHQLVGMRGLMANPQGNIIDLPIQSNLREGLSLTEYIISCYGARKGVVDTAVRTADAGYLTRRLVEVVQHVVIRNRDCETFQGIRLNSIRDRKTFTPLLSLPDRLIGRVLARDIFIGHRCIAVRNQDLAPDLVNFLVNSNCQIIVRSPLTCKSMPRICQRCYGWDLSCGSLVELGAAIGIVAGQSIGEPGTQLTLRTFHTGGVFTGGVAEHVRAPFNGIVYFSTDTIQPTRNRHGRPAWTCPEAFSVTIEDQLGKKNILNVPQYSLLLVKNHQYVQSRQIIAEVRATTAPLKEKIEKDIYSHIQGEVVYNPTGLRVSCSKQRNLLNKVCSYSRFTQWLQFASLRSYVSPMVEQTNYIWIFSGRLSYFSSANVNLSFLYQVQDYIQKDLPIGKQNDAVNQKKLLYTSFHNQQRSVVKKSLGTEKLFSGHTGCIYTISQQTESMLTLSSNDQFSMKLQGIYPTKILKKKILINYSTYNAIISLAREKIFFSYIGLIGKFSRKNQNISNLAIQTFIPKIQTNFSFFEEFLLQEKRKNKNFSEKNKTGTLKISIFFLNWFYYKFLLQFTTIIQPTNIGHSICKGITTLSSALLPESGHILGLYENHIFVRLAKIYLVPTGTKIHTYHKQPINEGDTLITFAYERLKASDIIQGLPKAEQLLEARLGNQVVTNLHMRFEFLVACIKEQLRNFVGSLPQMDLMLSQVSVNRAYKALEYSQMETVDQVQKVYLSQGVYISDKHFEVIVRQMSSKVVIVENTDLTAYSPKSVMRTSYPYNILGVFFPGELLEISKAQRMNRVLNKPLPCKPVLLGITQASLNANSFLSEASFERTITVLSRSALQGRMDWLKGLKENVLLSKMIPAGTGLKQFALQPLLSIKKQKHLKKKKTWASIYKMQSTICLCKPLFSSRTWFHSSLKQITDQSVNNETKKYCLQQLTKTFFPARKENNIYYITPKISEICSISQKYKIISESPSAKK